MKLGMKNENAILLAFLVGTPQPSLLEIGSSGLGDRDARRELKYLSEQGWILVKHQRKNGRRKKVFELAIPVTAIIETGSKKEGRRDYLQALADQEIKRTRFIFLTLYLFPLPRRTSR